MLYLTPACPLAQFSDVRDQEFADAPTLKTMMCTVNRHRDALLLANSDDEASGSEAGDGVRPMDGINTH